MLGVLIANIIMNNEIKVAIILEIIPFKIPNFGSLPTI